MAKGILLAIVAVASVAVVTFALSRYAYPEYVRLKEKHMEQQTELEEKRLERDQALVEEAEESLLEGGERTSKGRQRSDRDK